MIEDWTKLEPGCATLVSVTRPGQVPDDLAMDDEPQGPVPDYFFTQSAVLPYRRIDGQLEIMVIASRKGTRWVIPKGVKEPELSLRDSAGKEALEEAGVRGRLDEQPIGHYDYKKWGGVCHVAVFPMEVSESVPEDEWEESHRERRWLEARTALAGGRESQGHGQRAGLAQADRQTGQTGRQTLKRRRILQTASGSACRHCNVWPPVFAVEGRDRGKRMRLPGISPDVPHDSREIRVESISASRKVLRH